MNNKPTRDKTIFDTIPDSRTTLYTCPSQCISEVVFLSAEEASGTGVTATVEVYVSADSDRYLLVFAETPRVTLGKDTLSVYLNSSDRIEITAGGSSSPTLDVTLTVRETFIPVG